MHTLKHPPKKGVQLPGLNPKILIAEDNLVNQKLMSLLFSKLQIQVDLVSNGKDAVSAALNSNYDLILMDIQMPLMDGTEACRSIKNNLEGEAPAIVALTANCMSGDREKYLENGFDHYLPKPVSFEDIKFTLAQFTSH